MSKNTVLYKLRTFMMLTLSFAFLVTTTTQSQAASVIADTPCDSLYYESLSARAWLEAQREITQNQNIILKPDSVFEYTCFDRLVGELADHADEMLSETSSYGSPLSSTSMDNALQNLVINSLTAYINNNFGSKTGGGGYNLLAGHTAAAGINSVPQNMVGPAYNCDIMERVWNAAKCINFVSNSTTDGFFTFQEYATTADKRVLPVACSPITTNWATNLGAALTAGPWTNDPVQTYFALTTPQNCSGANCPCSGAPVPTGVRVIRSGFSNNDYDEHICLQPGCRYHPGGGDPLFSGGSTASAGCYGR
ncbi:MAG: hypothetical protein ACTHOO_10770 [Alcanivorax sp.]